MKRILIIGDSLAMPREGVSYEQTWPYLLIKKFPNFEFIDKTKRASQSERLVKEGGGYKGVKEGADLLEHYRPDVVIIQLGITDCAPRYYRRKSILNLIIRFSPDFIKVKIFKFIKKHCRRKSKYAFTTPSVFRQNFQDYLERALLAKTKVIVVPIIPANQRFIEKSPEITSSIQNFNRVFSSLSKQFPEIVLIENFKEDIIEKITIDELHLNPHGNHLIFEKLVTHL